MLINHLLRIINTQNTIWHRFRTKCVRIIHLRSMFKRKNSVFPFPPNPPPSSPPKGGREKGKEKLDFAARTLSLNKQYLHSLHQIYIEKYYFKVIFNFLKQIKWYSHSKKLKDLIFNFSCEIIVLFESLINCRGVWSRGT